MSSVKANKSRVIKSVTKKDFLTLLCEWGDCGIIYDQIIPFLCHVQEHLQNFLSCDLNTVDPSLEGEFKCPWKDCGHQDIVFSSVIHLIRHIFFHGYHVKLKGIGVSLLLKNEMEKCNCNSETRNTIPDLEDRFVCTWKDCGVACDNAELFYSHVSNHADVYPHGNFPAGGCKCCWDGCDVVVKSKHKLKEHLRSHSQEKLMACPTCGNLYSSATKFFDHIQRQSDGIEKNYQCSHCNKRYATERLLRDHLRHHVYCYKCPFCDMTCSNPSSLRTHIHYRHTEERVHLCQICDYRGKSAVDLRRHLAIHEHYWIDCEVEGCNFHSRYLWELRLHYRNHHQGNKPAKYACHMCNKKYRRGSRLTSHLRIVHQFKLLSGHTRFRYKQHEDGNYRLLTIRYESLEMTEQNINSTSDNNAVVIQHEGEAGEC